MISDELKAELLRRKEKIEQLEAEQQQISLDTYALILPVLDSEDNCEQLLDLLPLGFLTFKVRQAQSVLDAHKESVT